MSYRIDLTPNASYTETVSVSQDDVGREIVIDLYKDGTSYTPASGTVITMQGTKPSGLGYTITGTASGSSVTFLTTAAMTQEFGRFPSELVLTNGTTVIGTANFALYVERNPHPAETIDGTHETMQNLTVRMDELEDDMDALETSVTSKADASAVGALADLTTTAKTSVVAAVNEVDAEATELRSDVDMTMYKKTFESATLYPGYIGTDGLYIASTVWRSVDFLYIPSETDVVTIKSTLYQAGGVAFYDETHTCLSYVNGNNATNYGYTASSSAVERTFDVPSGTVYVRFCVSKTSVTASDMWITNIGLNDVVNVLQKVDSTENIKPYTFTTSSGYISSTGSITSASPSSQEVYTSHIAVEEGDIVRFTQSLAVVANVWIALGLYDSDDTFIRRETLYTANSKTYYSTDYEVPAGVSYLSFTCRSYGASTITIGKNVLETIKEDIADLESSAMANPILLPAKPRFAMHRGLSATAPENTIPAFTLAGQAGAWAIETDVYETSDGYFVCHHDQTVDRMTDGTGTITSMTYAQIQALTIDAGNNIGSYSGLKIPLLSDFLKICRRYGCVAFIDIQTVTIADYGNMVSLVKEYGMLDSTVFLCGSTSKLNYVKLYTDTACALVGYSESDSEALIESATRYKNVWVDFSTDTITDDSYMTLAHASNIPVIVWVTDSTDDADAYVGYGVDVITSNSITALS